MIELEKKSWIFNPRRILKKLCQEATYIRSYIKKDIYYVHISDKEKLSSLAKSPLLFKKLRIFRIRKQDNKYILTYKHRKIRDFCELNVENEISLKLISKWKNFFYYIQYTPFLYKKKKFNYLNIKIFL